MRVLALVESPDHVCCRYRIRAFEPHLRSAGWSLTCQELKHATLSRLAQFYAASSYDCVLLQRRLLPVWQLGILRKNARQLVFDFDDAILYRDSYARRGPYSRVRQARFAATVQAADTVFAGNDFLADCALRAGAPPTRVRTIPTCVEPENYPEAEPLHAEPVHGASCDLVWIGSSSTLQGLERQREIWDRLGREIPNLRIRVICDRFPSFETLRVVPVPWSQAWEARDLAAGQVGISWLPDDPWSRGKCGLKVLQYQAARLPVVANPVGMHHELIEEGITGFLPRSVEEWIAAIRTLAGAENLRSSMGRIARRRVEKGYSVTAWAETFAAGLASTETPVANDAATSRPLGHRAIPRPFYARARPINCRQETSIAGRPDDNHRLDDPMSPSHTKIYL